MMIMDFPLLLEIGVIGIYFISSLGGISIVKFLNYYYCFTIWWIFGLVNRSTWIFSAVLHYWILLSLQKQQVAITFLPSLRQVRVYFLVAIGLSLVEIINSFTMTILPGSLYMLIKGSDVGFSMLLSYFLLNKTYTRMKLIAACLIMLGIGIVFGMDILKNKEKTTTTDLKKNDDQEDDEGELGSAGSSGHRYWQVVVSIPAAALFCLVGAFLNSLLAVATEAFLKQTLKEEEEKQQLQQQEVEVLSPRQSSQAQSQQSSTTAVVASPPSQRQQQQSPTKKLFLSNAYSMWTSFFSFLLLVIPVIVLSQKGDDATNRSWQQQPQMGNSTTTIATSSSSSSCSTYDWEWEQQQQQTTVSSSSVEDFGGGTTTTTVLLVIIIFCLFLLMTSRFLERLCKHFICVYDSAYTFSIVQAARRWLGIYIVGIMFGEQFELGMILGSCISGIGFLLNTYNNNHSPPGSDSGSSKSSSYKKLSSELYQDDDDDDDANTTATSYSKDDDSNEAMISGHKAEMMIEMQAQQVRNSV